MALKPCERQAEPHPSSLAVPFPGAMALKLSSVFTCLSVTSLAVPFPGAMALKRRSNTQQSSTLATCSPLPRGDGAETISLVYVTLDLHYLAVPFPGAMALKRYNRLEDHQRLRPCSPLPRGDGAETDYAAADMFAFFSICAMPGPFSWLSACRLDDSMYSNILHKAYCTQTGFCMKSGYICEVKNLSLEHRSGCSH